jgi:DNA polymerase elongation subunit (family B)
MSVTKKIIGKYFKLIDFHVYDQKEDEESENDSVHSQSNIPQFTIQMFGLNETGDTCSITINDYEPFFYIKVGNDWDQGIANQLLDEIKKKIWKLASSVLSIQIVDYHKLYGFSGGKKCRFVKITFANMAAFNRVKGLWYKYDEETNQRKSNPFIFQGVQLQLYESNIPPLLRYFHLQNISPSGWVSIHTPRCIIPQPKTTTCKYEYICSQKCVKPAVERETRVPYKICSFDIEASSSHGDFPLPKKTYKRLATNIVDAFQRQLDVLTTAAAKKKFISKAIMAAFTYDRMDDIDLIYTVGDRPEKTDVKTMIDTLLESKIDIHSATKEESTIESMFEKMKEQQLVTFDHDEDDEIEDAAEETELTMKKKELKNKKVKKTTPDTFIYDLLSSDEFTREKKIIGLNKLLTMHFPKVEGDKVTFIGSTFLKYGDSTPYLNHCVVLDTCEPVEGVEILSVDSEDKVLTEWAKLIQRENPDIIIGYNIFGFDYEFMFQRSLETGCHEPFLQLSRKRGEICGKKDKEEGWKLDNTQLKIASGEYDLRYPTMSGRLQIDLYAYFRRDFNLTSYKLDDVAGQYISDEIKKTIITEDGNTQIYSKNLAGLHVDDFIHIKINSFSSDYFNNGQKFKVIAIENGVEYSGKKYNVITITGSHDIPEPSGSIVSIDWGMAKDDVTPQDIFRLTRGSAADRAVVAKYCIQDCNLVHHLMSKLDVITGYTEMSSICSVPITFLVFRGQGIKLTSYVAKKCREKNTLMPDLDKSCGNEGYEGAIVLPPKCSMYIDNPVACVDYSSLYPSSMISQNYSHDSKVWSKEYDMNGKLIKVTGEQDKKGNFIYDNMPGYHYINIEFKTYKYLRTHPLAVAKKTQIGTKICRWAQLPNGAKSIMPSILTELLDARAATRKKAKSESDPFMQNILDKRQLGYKVTANSLYGQCGAKTSTFYDMDVAASTTATGQMMITYAKRMIEEVYGDSVYETAQHGTVKCNAEYVYGDSVANYTPITVRISNSLIETMTIEHIAVKYGNDNWTVCSEEGKESKEYCELEGVESWTESGWTKLYRVIRHALAPHKKMVRVLTHTGLVDVTDDHSLLKPNGEEISPKDCQIGTKLLHNSIPINSKIYTENPIDVVLNCEYISDDMLYLAKIATIAIAKGYYIKISELDNSYFVLEVMEKKIVNSNKITVKRAIKYNGNYVYDLTTENHHFAAGIGNLIVHNTDSVFFTFNLTNPATGEKIRGKPALEMTIEIAQEAAQLCTSYLKPPMGLAYEKTLMPFILLSKKRYVGMLYEDDPNDGYLKFMGLVLKRRDNCDLVKDVYGGILHNLMNSTNIQLAIDFLNKSLEDLIQGKIPMDKLSITKALRGDYKNPAAIAHRVLADRIAQRDPGNKPKPGDRIKYVYFNNKGAKLQGDKIETPEFIIENGLQIDYTHYITNQLMKPLQQLFGLAIEQIWELQNKGSAIKTFKKDMVQLQQETEGDLEVFMKKREKYTSAKIKMLLFDKFLTKVFNQQNGVRTLNEFFGTK